MVNYFFKNKIGQMKIQQMAFMLIAVMLFFALAGLVVLSLVFSGVEDAATNINEENAQLLSAKIANSAEFSCGGAFGTSKTGCIDADKVMILKDRREIYENFWETPSIQIRKIYPASSGGEDVECEIGGQGSYLSECNLITILDKNSVFSIGNFVSLCHKEYDQSGSYNKCELAKIYVGYEVV